MGDDQWAKKVNMVFAGKQAGNFDDGFEDLMGKADAAAGDGSLLDGTLTAPDIESLRKEQKGKGAEDEDEDEEEEPSKDEELPDVPKDDWFDSSIKIRKAERAFASRLKNIYGTLGAQHESMRATLVEFAANKEWSAAFHVEILTMADRLKWLQALTASDTVLLRDLKDGQEQKMKEAHENPSRSAAASSQDMTSVLRAGPCLNWQKLVHKSEVDAHIPKAKEQESADEVKEWSAGCDHIFRQWSVLLASCRSAVNDVLAARTHAEADAKKDEERKAEEAKKLREGAAAPQQAKNNIKKSKEGIHLLNLDFVNTLAMPIVSLPEWPETPMDLRAPLVVSGCNWIQEKIKESKAMFLCLFCRGAFSNKTRVV